MTRARRSLVYAPATQPDTATFAANTDADGIILDLESTVDDSEKEHAREQLQTIVDSIDVGTQESIVRINDLRGDRWQDDIRAALDAGVDTLRLPKIESPTEVIQAVSFANGHADYRPEFLLQLETPLGLLNGREIALTSAEFSQVTGIGIGIGDYTTALGLPGHGPELRAFVLNQCAAFAAVGEMDALAYVHKDLDSLREAAALARDLGHVGQPISHAVDVAAFIDILHDIYPA